MIDGLPWPPDADGDRPGAIGWVPNRVPSLAEASDRSLLQATGTRPSAGRLRSKSKANRDAETRRVWYRPVSDSQTVRYWPRPDRSHGYYASEAEAGGRAAPRSSLGPRVWPRGPYSPRGARTKISTATSGSEWFVAHECLDLALRLGLDQRDEFVAHDLLVLRAKLENGLLDASFNEVSLGRA